MATHGSKSNFVIYLFFGVLVFVPASYLISEIREQWYHHNWLDHPNKIERTGQ